MKAAGFCQKQNRERTSRQSIENLFDVMTALDVKPSRKKLELHFMCAEGYQ
jgi:hypothetical protein